MAEVNRLMRLLAAIVPDEDQAALRRGLSALLVAMDRYRAYLVPGAPADQEQLQVLAHAEARAAALVADADQDAVGIVALLAEGTPLDDLDEAAEAAHREFMVRFQQTCGPVMAKGIEDTAFYRYARLTGLNEVGGDPGHLGLDPGSCTSSRAGSWPPGRPR